LTHRATGLELSRQQIEGHHEEGPAFRIGIRLPTNDMIKQAMIAITISGLRMEEGLSTRCLAWL
jgi:hypothetical protein